MAQLPVVAAKGRGNENMTPPIRVGERRELFLDDHLIEQMDGLKRRVTPARKNPAGPVIVPQSPLEPMGYCFGSVLYDADERQYKAWLMGCRLRDPKIAPHAVGGYYFVSEDGLHWDRPQLDCVDGGAPNQFAALDSAAARRGHWPMAYEFFGVTHDPNEADPQRRYKLGGLFREQNYQGPAHPNQHHEGERRGLFVACSADGMHWSPHGEPATHATVDGLTTWMHEPDGYVLYGRTRYHAPDMLARFGDDPFFQKNNWGRSVTRAASRDFFNWEPAGGDIVMAADPEDGIGAEIYGMHVFPYEGIYIGLVQVFHNYAQRIWLEVQLAVSRDNISFTRLSDRTPFIPAGDVGSWDRFNQAPANSPPIAVGENELRFYYSGRNIRHSTILCNDDDDGIDSDLPYLMGLGAASIQRDRFAGLEATFATGVLRTRLLQIEHPGLYVNLEAPYGALDVVLLDEAGRPIAGATATVTQVDSTQYAMHVPELAAAARNPLQIEFRLRNARLYSFWSAPLP